MNILIADVAPDVQDQIHVALESFDGVEVDVASDFVARDKIRRREYDCVFVGISGNETAGKELLDTLRSEMPLVKVVVVAAESVANKLKEDKVRGRIFAFQSTPIQPVEFFRLIGRLLQRSDPIAR